MNRARRSLVALLLVGAASAQVPASRPARIAIVDDAPEAARARLWADFRHQLGKRGYVEGANLVVDYRSAGGDLSRLDAICSDVMASKPDVIVTVTTTVALAARKATTSIPIVALGPADPVKSGLVQTLARPGGNLTGASQNQAEIAGKWVDLLREIAPDARSVAYLTDTGNPGEMLVFREVQQAAQAAGIGVEALDGATSEKVADAFATIARKRAPALIVATTSSLLPQRTQIVEAAAKARLPAIYARREYTDAGGLLSYGTDFGAVFARGVDYVVRILRGAKPSDLPFEMASSFTLVVNMATARQLGIVIPQSVRVRADEVKP